MKVSSKLTLAFCSVTALIGVVGYLILTVAEQVSKLRTVELPMEQSLREVEVSIWEAIHAADAYKLTGDSHYADLYRRQLADVEKFSQSYFALIDTGEEKAYAEEFGRLWSDAKAFGDSLIEETNKEREATRRFYEAIDAADEIIDTDIQGKFSPADPNLLAKEQALREVEVSIWEAIHAEQQHTGLSGDVSRESRTKVNFQDLMEKQFRDVEEFWSRYKELAQSESEAKPIRDFEVVWETAVSAGRGSIEFNTKGHEKFDLLYARIDSLDDVIDLKMQRFIQKRIEARDRKSEEVRKLTIVIVLLSLAIGVGIALATSRNLVSGVRRCLVFAERVAGGELTARLQIGRRDEFGTLAIALNSMAEQIAKRGERALRLSEERFQIVSRATHDGIWDWDLETNTVWFSESFATLLGYQAGQLAPNLDVWKAGIHPDDSEAVMATLSAFLKSGEETWQDEYRFRRADGTYAFVLDRGHVVHDSSGKALRMVGSLMDISERKVAEAELHAAKECADAANRAKSEFLSNMSHEIRTPMNGILGMTELVLETKLNREQREYLDMAQNSALSLLSLINEILDFSKIEAGKLELEAISFSLRDCLGSMLKPLGIRADQKGLELTADISAVVPDHLIGDPMRLRQILTNLTDNAIKFTERGDVVLGVTVDSVTEEEHCLHFSVTDTGAGIPAEKQALIFEAFTQADGTTTRTYGGTGLGLSIASQLAQHMGGRIWVESTVGEGTTFHFTARLPVRHTPAPNVRHANLSELEGMRVLVVDDNAVNRRILREMLLHWQMQPSVVASGAAAIVEMLHAAHAGAPFPLVILDGMMPEMDGFMVVEKIREHAELSGATVMMLSSAMPAGAAARCDELGVASYLTKPVTQAELIDAILIAISGAIEIEPMAVPAETKDVRVREEKTEPERNSGSIRPQRVLIAEDNAVNRVLATAQLKKLGYVADSVTNGIEVLEAFGRIPYDIILMDCQMPELDGYETTRQLRSLGGQQPLIIAITANAMQGDRELCLAAGMDSYLSKPMRTADLKAALDEAAGLGSELLVVAAST